MNKEELLVEIGKIPLFRFRDVATKEEKVEEGEVVSERWVEDDKSKAITEVDSVSPIAFVCEKYQLVQFKDMFKPIVENIEDCRGAVIYNRGFAIMDVFPSKEEYKTNGDRIGIVAYNSVNKTSALNIRFCVEHNNRKITIPSKVASFRKVHLGNIGEMTQDYIGVITKVKSSWNTIMTKFTAHNVELEDLPKIAENFKIDENAVKHMKKKMLLGRKYNLWDFCMGVFDYLSKKSFKSDVHKRKRLDKFVNTIFDYDLVMQI